MICSANGLAELSHFHLLIPDDVFAQAGDGLMFVLLPAPNRRGPLALLDRVIRRVARRLANDAGDTDPTPDLFAQARGTIARMAQGVT